MPRSNVLIVDDVTKNLQVVGTMLRNAGFAVIPATSGAEALEGMNLRLPDLILLDLMMPEMDGLEVCRRLKANPLTQSIPVIFLTASNEMEHLVNGFAAGAVDYITKPFNAPELLARVRTHLELQHARVRLAELNEEKNEFMGIVAHDLRSPLGTIHGFAELLADDPEMERTEAQDYAGRIRDTARRMSEMVQNLLDANRIERGEMNVSLASCDLGEVASSVAEGFKTRAAAKEQTIQLELSDGPVQVQADRSVLVQVIENLISNAIKYSPRGKSIRIRVRAHEGNGRCEVQDEGPGVSEEDQKKLFGKFARLSAKPTGGEHSTGLGLSIVKRMVEAMGGEVWCESEPGQGATFVVQLPGV